MTICPKENQKWLSSNTHNAMQNMSMHNTQGLQYHGGNKQQRASDTLRAALFSAMRQRGVADNATHLPYHPPWPTSNSTSIDKKVLQHCPLYSATPGPSTFEKLKSHSWIYSKPVACPMSTLAPTYNNGRLHAKLKLKTMGVPVHTNIEVLG